jgi:hypothetical protein
MAAPVILTFNIQPEKLGKLRMLCARVKARLISADAGSALSLGDIIAGAQNSGPSGGATADAPAFTDEVLVMSGLSGTQINMFLQGFKRFGIPPVPLKAMLTATNAEWTPSQLHCELSAEREAFARGMSAHENNQTTRQ